MSFYLAWFGYKLLKVISWHITSTDPESFVRGDRTQLWQLYFLMRERGSYYHLKWTIIGPPAKGHLNGVSLVGRWWPTVERWLGSFVIFQRIWTSIAKELHSFVIFKGVGGQDPLSTLPFGSVHGWEQKMSLAGERLVSIKIHCSHKKPTEVTVDFFTRGSNFLQTFAWLLSLCLLVLITFANSLGPDQAWQNVRLCLDPNCLTYWKSY